MLLEFAAKLLKTILQNNETREITTNVTITYKSFLKISLVDNAGNT